MTAPLSEDRLAEINNTVPLGYDPPWYFQPAENGRDWVVGYSTDNPLAGLVATVPDYGMYLAEFIAVARTAVPELLAEVARLRAEVERLTPKPMVGITNVRVSETARSGWQVRYRLNGARKSQRHFPSKERADEWIDQQRERHGGAPTSTASTVQGDDES